MPVFSPTAPRASRATGPGHSRQVRKLPALKPIPAAKIIKRAMAYELAVSATIESVNTR
jgi:hypothetical protein